MGIMSLIVRSFKPVALLEVFNTAQHSEAHEDRA